MLFVRQHCQVIDSGKSWPNWLLITLRLVCSDPNFVISGGRVASIVIEFALTRTIPETVPGEIKLFLGLNEKSIASPVHVFEASLIVTPAGSCDCISLSRRVSIRRIASSLS